LELGKIQLDCSLEDAEFDTEKPDVYGRMLTEGRKTISRVRALLEDILRPQGDMSALSTVVVHVTDNLARDVKELNFGYQNDRTYETCHRGLSTFTVVNVSMSTMSSRSRKADRLKRATFLTPADVGGGDSFPDPIPIRYINAMELLKRYIHLLDAIVGKKCHHRQMVFEITHEMLQHAHVFEGLTPRHIASLLWQVFLDARRFFSDAVDHHGVLPMSNLQLLLSIVRSGDISVHSSMPFTLFSGESNGDPNSAYKTSGPAKGGATSSTHQEYASVPAKFVQLLGDARTRYPGIQTTTIPGANKPAIPYKDIRLGPIGACLDFLMFGKCMSPSCSYKHNKTSMVEAKHVDAAYPRVQKAWEAYKATNAT
jgi:hypothetical protein